MKTTKMLSVLLASMIVFSGCTSSNKSGNTQVQQQNETTTKKISYYFTANEGGSITKIDASTNKVVDTIKVQGAAHNVQVSPDGTIFGVTVIPGMTGGKEDNNMGMMGGTAAFYDVKTDKLTNSVTVGNHPAHIVFTQDGKFVLVTNNQDNNVSVIDAKSYKVIGTISTGKGPHGFRISRDSKFAYVANMGEDTISVIDITANKEVMKIKVGKTPVTTGITSDGKTLVATVNGEDALAVIDLATDKVEKIPVGKGPAQVYLENDDKFAFVANQGTEDKPSNSLTKIDLTTRKVVATITTGKGSHGVVVSPDNKFVYVTDMYDNTVSVIDNNTNTVIATVNVDKIPNGISYVQ